MSELKAYNFPVDHGDFTTTVEQFYHKSEADKVIAELRGDIKDLWDDKHYTDKMLDERNAEITELTDKCQMHDFFWEGCGFAKRGFKNTIAVSEAFDKLEAENAELKQNGAVLMRMCIDKDKWCLNKVMTIRHHKYKRCMDKVKQCTSMMIFNSKYGTDKKWHFFKKWRERWRELAEKFKPNKEAKR